LPYCAVLALTEEPDARAGLSMFITAISVSGVCLARYPHG